MKTFVVWLFVCTGCFALGYVFDLFPKGTYSEKDYFNDLRIKHEKQKEADRTKALELSNKTWYVVSRSSVSSEIGGKGTIIEFPQELISKGSRLGIIHVVKNLEVTFFPDSTGTSLVLDCLGYEYKNQKEIMTGKMPSIY